MLNPSNIYQPGFNQGAGMQNLVPNKSQMQRNPLGDQNVQTMQQLQPQMIQQPMQQRFNQQVTALQNYKPR